MRLVILKVVIMVVVLATTIFNINVDAMTLRRWNGIEDVNLDFEEGLVIQDTLVYTRFSFEAETNSLGITDVFNGTYKLIANMNKIGLSGFLLKNFHATFTSDSFSVNPDGSINAKKAEKLVIEFSGDIPAGTITNETICQIKFVIVTPLLDTWIPIGGGTHIINVYLHYTPPQIETDDTVVFNAPITANKDAISCSAICVDNIDENSNVAARQKNKPDIFLAELENIGSTSKVNYQYAWNIDTHAIPASFSLVFSKTLPSYALSMSTTLIDVNFDPTTIVNRNDLIIVYLVKQGNDTFVKYIIGWDLNNKGIPKKWSDEFSLFKIDNLQVPIGISCVSSLVDKNSFADLYIVVAYDNSMTAKLKKYYCKNIEIDGQFNPSNLSVLPDKSYFFPFFFNPGKPKTILGFAMSNSFLDANKDFDTTFTLGYEFDNSGGMGMLFPRRILGSVFLWNSNNQLHSETNSDFIVNATENFPFYTGYNSNKIKGIGLAAVDYDKDNLTELIYLDHTPDGKVRLWPIHAHGIQF